MICIINRSCHRIVSLGKSGGEITVPANYFITCLYLQNPLPGFKDNSWFIMLGSFHDSKCGLSDRKMPHSN